MLAYLRRTTGFCPAQLTRLVTRWASNRVAQRPLVKRYRAPAAPFARKYTAADVALLVEMDRAHEDVCGAAGARYRLTSGRCATRLAAQRVTKRVSCAGQKPVVRRK